MVKLKAAIMSLGSKSSEWTAEAMKKYFDQVDALDIRKIDIKISGSEEEIIYDGKPLADYDCIYAKGSFRFAPLLKTLTTVLEGKCYMPLSANSFTVAHDKLLTHLELQKHKIPMPKTFVSSTVPAAKKVLEHTSFPIIMKFPQGTGGKGVMFADSFASASSLLDALEALNQPFLIQEYIETGGKDLRLIVVGDKVIGSMMRHAAEGEARANFHSGGRGEKASPDSMTKKIAVQVAKAIQAEICAVDILPGSKGPLVMEANISPGLQLITETTKIDIPDIIAKHLYENTLARKQKKQANDSGNIMSEINKGAGGEKSMITNLSFRGGNMIVPEMITSATDFKPNDTFEIKTEKEKITISKMKIS
ncbi:RimK family alpha-L-glutamate ligase [Candidatus Woesearchaeota archaeon]|nr:RimK family alpha-L-glutamate ligase [Candidatus Woesearchaeota archaeon]